MVIGYHLTWTAYGLWLPNDPRGSRSHYVASDVIAELGALHYGRKKVQPAGWVIREFRAQAKEVLKFPIRTFGCRDIEEIAAALGETIAARPYTCYACAVMPDHIHILIRKHRDQAEEMIEHLQEASRLRLRSASLRGTEHPVWGGPGWKVFLDHPDQIRRTIKYIAENPAKWRLPRQAWPFVSEYDDWPFHKGRR